MKKMMYIAVAACMITLHSFAAGPSPIKAQTSDDYFVNDQQVEQLFTNSEDISLTTTAASLLENPAQKNGVANNKAFYASDKNFAVAIILNIFLGVLGIHRAYLGTKPLTWIGYILTCGGIFGIVPFIDFIVLIINNDDITPYIDNPKFFMWGGNDL